MKIAVIHGANDLRLDHIAMPVPGDRDLIVKVKVAGICGSDLHFHRRGGLGRGAMPLGHEFAGEVIHTGSAVSGFRPGDRVAYNSCNSPAALGCGGDFGGFAPMVMLRGIDDHPHSLCPLPPSLDFRDAALIEPMAVAVHAVRRSGWALDDSVAVFGAGPIGLGIILELRTLGCTDIVAIDPSPFRRERALALGARAAIDPAAATPASALAELRGSRSVHGMSLPCTDVYFEASGASGVLECIAGFCDLGSRIIAVAAQSEPLRLDAAMLMFKEISLMGAYGYPVEFPEVAARIASGELAAHRLVSHVLPFSEFDRAFGLAADAHASAKVLIDFASEEPETAGQAFSTVSAGPVEGKS